MGFVIHACVILPFNCHRCLSLTWMVRDQDKAVTTVYCGKDCDGIAGDIHIICKETILCESEIFKTVSMT